jgi:hypothetical protein
VEGVDVEDGIVASGSRDVAVWLETAMAFIVDGEALEFAVANEVPLTFFTAVAPAPIGGSFVLGFSCWLITSAKDEP